MNQNTIQLLEYDKIKNMLMEQAISEQGKELIAKLHPSIDPVVIQEWLNETTETRHIIERSSGIPLHSLAGADNAMSKLGKGTALHPEDLTVILTILQDVKKIRRFMKGMEAIAPKVSTYAASMFEVNDLTDEIERCIFNDMVDDRASTTLYKTRKQIAIAEERIKSKLDAILRSSAYSSSIQDSVVSMRNGRYVIPVKREYKKNVEGAVLDTSGSGSTLFIEPAAVKKLQDELNLLRIDEEKEVYKILCSLTSMVESYQREITINIEAMAHYDFLFAKAKLSRSMDGNTVKLNTRNFISISGGRHPLIGKSAVPLDFNIGDSYRGLVITGPNTGGKTVVLKTIGLLTLMVQSGLHVPVDKDGEFAVFRDVLVDIGDGQSIEQSLSTFSSHIKNIIHIIECADPYTLVIVDELGAGTDPGEGMGIAIAVLEELGAKGSTLLATTHYSEIKAFADETEGFENGCMEFNIDTLKPLYRLKIGKAGESNAFLIALRLGMKKTLIERAHEITYMETKQYQDYMPLTQNENSEGEIVQHHKEQAEKLKKTEEARELIEQQNIVQHFNLGDCVHISSMDRTGIVCELENSKGEVGVMVMKKKIIVNKKRLSLYIGGDNLYPQDYDFDVIFENKENRKKRKQMSKKHVDGMTIEVTED